MGQLQNRVCVVTGGGGSIGFASAQAFVAEGARVMLVAIIPQSLERCVAQLLGAGVAPERVAFWVADVGSTADTVAYLSAAVERWGKIDVLFRKVIRR